MFKAKIFLMATLVPSLLFAEGTSDALKDAGVQLGFAAGGAAATYFINEKLCPSDTSGTSCAIAAMTAGMAIPAIGSAIVQNGKARRDVTDQNYDFNQPDPLGPDGTDPLTEYLPPGFLNDYPFLRDDFENGNLTLGEFFNNNQGELQSLANKGYKVDAQAGTVTLPNGKTMSAGGLSSASGLKEAGLSEDEIRRVLERQAKLKNALGRGIAEDGSGSGAAGPADSSWKAPGLGWSLPKMAGLAKPDVRGLSKNLNGEPIGVASDNLFEMITRRYRTIQSEGKLLSNP